MRESSYTDPEGRQFAVLMPEGVTDREAYRGLPLGPPPLDGLDLPRRVEVRLNNELFNRRIFTYDEARRRLPEIAASIMAACRLDAMDVLALYLAPSLDELPEAILSPTIREDEPSEP